MVVAFQIALMLAAPVALAIWLRGRWPLSWRAFGVGAVTFVGSQVVHVPLNAVLLAPLLVWLGSGPVWLPALLLGLSAGVCEEGARYVAFRWWSKGERTGPHALLFGAGHGGIESMLLGALVALTALNVAFIERAGVESLGLTPELQELTRQQLAAFHAAPVHARLLAVFERLCVIVFHVAASALVLVAVVRRRAVWLLAAVGLHTALNAGALVTLHHWGPNVAEIWVGLMTIPSLLLLGWSLRVLPVLEPPQPAKPPRPSGEPIELRAVEKSFGDVHALRGVSFVIPRGQRACLLGPNGAGKTTAIRLVTGAFTPTRGWALLFGTSADDPGFLDAKRRTGIVPQQAGMYEEMTVKQYLDLVAALYRVDDYGEVAERLGLGEYLERSTAKLSGGMQRRLCLAAALMSHPDLLILDEPSAGLDPLAARDMTDLLHEVSRERTTLLCTHDLAEAEELCDAVIILQNGSVLVHETIAELREQAAITVAVRAAEGVEALAAALRRGGYDATIAGEEVRLHPPDGERSVPGLLRHLLAEGLAIYECRLIRPTLEDLFLSLVRKPPAERSTADTEVE